jgi:hypothetical protein
MKKPQKSKIDWSWRPSIPLATIIADIRATKGMG